MQWCAVGLLEIATAVGAMQLAPQSPAGMPVGRDIAQTEPAPIGTGRLGAEVRRRVHLGLDHGVGHSLLLLYDAKAPNCQKSKDFKGLGHYPCNTILSSFRMIIELQHLYNYLTFLLFLTRY